MKFKSIYSFSSEQKNYGRENFKVDIFRKIVCKINSQCVLLGEAAACNKFYSLSVRLGFSLQHLLLLIHIICLHFFSCKLLY